MSTTPAVDAVVCHPTPLHFSRQKDRRIHSLSSWGVGGSQCSAESLWGLPVAKRRKSTSSDWSPTGCGGPSPAPKWDNPEGHPFTAPCKICSDLPKPPLGFRLFLCPILLPSLPSGVVLSRCPAKLPRISISESASTIPIRDSLHPRCMTCFL